MIKFIIKRLLQAAIVMFVISLIGFSIQSSLGDPINELTALQTSKEEKDKLREQLGLNDPFLIQYSRFIKNIGQGDFGTSYFYKEQTIKIILEKLPATLELVFSATLIIIFVAIPIGCYCAIKPNSWLTKLALTLSIIGISVPIFLTGIIAIFIFSIYLGWLPSFGRGDIIHVFGYWHTNFASWDGIKHIILPSVILSSIMMPLFIRLTRSEMIEVLSSEYIKFAKAKGLKNSAVWYKHAFKNTLLPLITVGGIQIGTMIAYTILTETIFQWPGIGFMFLESIKRSDIPLITTYLIFVGFIFVIVNTIVDLLYGLINPTISITGDKK